MKALSNSDKLKALIAPKMIDLVRFLDNNRKYYVYKGGNIHVIYSYLEMIVDPNNLPLQVSALIILVLHLPSTIINHLPIQLLQLSS